MPIYLFNKTFLPLTNAYIYIYTRSPFYCGHAIIGIRHQGGRGFQSISAPTIFLHSCLLVPLVISNNMLFMAFLCLSYSPNTEIAYSSWKSLLYVSLNVLNKMQKTTLGIVFGSALGKHRHHYIHSIS